MCLDGCKMSRGYMAPVRRSGGGARLGVVAGPVAWGGGAMLAHDAWVRQGGEGGGVRLDALQTAMGMLQPVVR